MLSTLSSTLNPDCYFAVSPQTSEFLRFSGGDDGARTRDLCRDRIPNTVTDGKHGRWMAQFGP
jgi:hypothetical protein